MAYKNSFAAALGKRDKNEPAIIQALRDCGYRVDQMRPGVGYDLLCWGNGYLVLIEVKNPALKWEMTGAELAAQEDAALRNIPYSIVTTPTEAIKAMHIF